MSEFVLYMMLIFFPGIIAYEIFNELTEHHEHKVHKVIIYTFLFGSISYLFYYLIGNIFIFIINLFPIQNNFIFDFHFFNTLKSPKDVEYKEIMFVSFLSVIVGFGITYISTHRWLHRFARSPFGCKKYGLWISRKHGELDTFTYLLYSRGNNVWVIVRDIEDNFAYYGAIYAYSAGHEKSELYLEDVKVYNNKTGEEVMTSPGIYLSKPKEKYIIEFIESIKEDIIK